MESIKYSEIMYLMDQLDDKGLPIPFSFTSATASGRFLTMHRAVKNVLDKDDNDIQAIRHAEPVMKKDHNRAAKKMWYDIKDLESGEIRRIYPRTITMFNGLKLSFDI
jgi:hypothetical protein